MKICIHFHTERCKTEVLKFKLSCICVHGLQITKGEYSELNINTSTSTMY